MDRPTAVRQVLRVLTEGEDHWTDIQHTWPDLYNALMWLFLTQPTNEKHMNLFQHAQEWVEQ